MNFPYSKEPIILRNLFDKNGHEAIVDFVENVAPTLNPASDTSLPDSIKKFNRRSLYKPKFLVDIHEQLTDYASTVFGVRVKPSYSFLSMYEPDGKCYLHVDRPQCRFTIDYLVNQHQQEPWPICISDQVTDDEINSFGFRGAETEQQTISVMAANKWNECLLSPNDAVCYSGTNAWHYRPTRSSGKVNLVFFHFVEEAWDGELD